VVHTSQTLDPFLAQGSKVLGKLLSLQADSETLRGTARSSTDAMAMSSKLAGVSEVVSADLDILYHRAVAIADMATEDLAYHTKANLVFLVAKIAKVIAAITALGTLLMAIAVFATVRGAILFGPFSWTALTSWTFSISSASSTWHLILCNLQADIHSLCDDTEGPYVSKRANHHIMDQKSHHHRKDSHHR
jgi:hypothetical protein